MYCWLCLNAGSGKSTLIKFIIEALNLEAEDVSFVAFTGKAATVLRQKGNPNPTTAHKLLYKAKQLPNGKFLYFPVPIGDIEYKLIVVDEVSMLPKSMWEQLLKHRIPVIACGDPEQLPPVSKDEDNHILDNPHIFLDEIMRQAQDSEIIRLSMHIREGKPLISYRGTKEHVQVLSRSELTSSMYDWADQILCAKNETRNKINMEIRALHGKPEEPVVGDKIIGLRNQWDFFSSGENKIPLTNGTIGTITWMNRQDFYIPKYIYHDGKLPFLFTNLATEDGDQFDSIPIDYNSLLKGEKTLTDVQEYKLRKAHARVGIEPPYEFAYAYAITTWKAQGSEWDKVILFEESFPFDTIEHRKYVYTGVTRAASKLLVVKK